MGFEKLDSARNVLDRDRGRHAAGLGLSFGMQAAPRIALGLCLGYFLLTALFEPSFTPWLLPGFLLVFLSATVVRTWLQTPKASTMDAALALDRTHHSKDRISAALEFSGREGQELDRFRAAAIEDGETFLQTVPAATKDLDEGWRQPQRPWAGLLLALAICCIPALLPLGDRTPDKDQPVVRNDGTTKSEEGDQQGNDAEPSARRENATDMVPSQARPPQLGKPGQTPKTKPQNKGSGAAAGPAAEQAAQRAAGGEPKENKSKAKASEGQGGGGQAESGEQSGGEQKAAAKQAKKKRKPVAKKPLPQNQRPPQKNRTPSPSSTTPGGSSRARGRSVPVGNKRSSRDVGLPRPDDEDPEDEDVEDEKEENEQRGGVMPMARDRRRSASRELAISGDGPPNDGRGGPSPQKKARGTASLVLGLRLPDQVRGQPNAGTAKTSLEPTTPQRTASGTGQTSGPTQAEAPPTVQSREPALPGRLWPALLRRYHELLRLSPQFRSEKDKND